MKSSLKAFPYPVLGRLDDFIGSAFQSIIDFNIEQSSDTDIVVIRYTFALSNDELSDLLQSGHASFALDVKCTDTLYREVITCESQSGEFKFEDGELYGKVVFEPIIYIKKHVPNFTALDLNDEFKGANYNLAPGDIVAIDDPQVRFIEFNKLKFESLVRVQTSSDIPVDTYRFDLSDDILIIMMGKDFRRLWDYGREEKDKAPYLTMSVYKDCIHAALDFIIKNQDESDNIKWARALKVKLSTLGKSIGEDSDFNDLNTLAQQLVSKIGIQRLLKNVE
jgi:hypothetical protein